MAVQFMGNDDTYNLIKLGINASNVRAKAIANNMANVNTKNYKRFNVVFEENLNKDNSSSLELKKTRKEHISNGDESQDGISIERDTSTSMRNDGNNVDLDVEKVNQAANTLKYNALITDINNKFNNLKTVIK
ncbi:flagellar basal-body rod protein FlgB [Clostridium sp. DL-VIII]|uniref:flagellar basal body rod protein FlgB n=1 Tax=Clostridium sp. DL-VIII TaxID=641107 RepID=UPI00023B0628|nr:flagellar basal body rod protein FlgB [Clostridium sp. DL-VIII]EHJ01487.1 flagellar basal-body rod protein FlgB [Clostridium sp. DL-VIII]